MVAQHKTAGTAAKDLCGTPAAHHTSGLQEPWLHLDPPLHVWGVKRLVLCGHERLALQRWYAGAVQTKAVQVPHCAVPLNPSLLFRVNASQFANFRNIL